MRKLITLAVFFAASVVLAGDLVKQTLTPTTGTSQSYTPGYGARLLVRCTVGACYQTCDSAKGTCTAACATGMDLEAGEKWPIPLSAREDTIAIIGRDGTTSCKVAASN